MMRVQGPIRELLEENAGEERVALVEQAVSARRLGRGPRRVLWKPAWVIAGLAIAGTAVAAGIVSLRTGEPTLGEEVPAKVVVMEEIVPAPAKEPVVQASVEVIEPRVEQPVPRTMERTKVKPAAAIENVDSLWSAADQARAQGEYSAAVTLLERISAEYSSDPRAGLASFTAARIEQDQLARPAEAAAHLERALSLGLAEELREPARARLLDARVETKESIAAVHAATDYLLHHPRGERAADARRIAGVEPQ